jgi:uncharacterized protein
MNRIIHLARLLFLLAVTLPALTKTLANIPAPTRYIDDYAHVFSSSAQSDMEALSVELHTKTRAQVFVVTVNTTEDEPIEKFANELFAKWKIGEKKTDRGALMLFAIKDRKRWIEIGYGLEGILNDAKVGDIGRSMVPDLQAANYDGAAQGGLRQITQIIATESGVTLDSLNTPSAPIEQNPTQPAYEPQPSHPSIDIPGLIFPIVWFGIIGFVILRAIWRRRQGIAPGAYYYGSSGSSANDSSESSFSSSSDDSFSGGDGGSSGGGGAGGDW